MFASIQATFPSQGSRNQQTILCWEVGANHPLLGSRRIPLRSDGNLALFSYFGSSGGLNIEDDEEDEEDEEEISWGSAGGMI